MYIYAPWAAGAFGAVSMLGTLQAGWQQAQAVGFCHLDSSHSIQGTDPLAQKKKSDANYTFVIQKQLCFEGCFLSFACPCKPR